MKKLLLALPALLLFAGCFDSDQETVLYADGSGKVTWTILVKADKPDEEGFKEADAQELANSTEGIVAWGAPEKVSKDGWTGVKVTAYFDDINKVKFYKSETDRTVVLEFEYVKGEQGSSLTIKDQMSNDATKGAEDEKEEPQTEEAKKMAEEMKVAMRDAMKGFRYAVAAVVPGTVTEAPESMKKAGRKVTWELNEKLMLDAIDEKPEAKEQLEKMKGPWVVKWGKDEVAGDEVEKFKKEKAAATAAWEEKKGGK